MLVLMAASAFAAACSGGSKAATAAPPANFGQQPDTEAGLKAAVTAYGEAFNRGDVATAYQSFSQECRLKYRVEQFRTSLEFIERVTKAAGAPLADFHVSEVQVTSYTNERAATSVLYSNGQQSNPGQEPPREVATYE